MAKAYLISVSSGERKAIGRMLIIGRTRDCGMIIDDNAASRRHVEISQRDGRYLWKDLGSTNGTIVNDSPMLAGSLKSGDTIRIGETEFRFEMEETPDSKSQSPVKEDSRIFQETIIDDQGEARSPSAERKTSSLLEALYSVINDIAANFEPCPLMDRVLETTVRAINAQRGAILLAGPGEELLPCPECGQVHRIVDGKLRPAAPHEIRISSTVARRVIRGGESVLYQDTDADSELNTSESILNLKLRSILCVPLRAKDTILGVLYIDSDRGDRNYVEDDLLLAAAVGNSAGIALDNARMQQNMLEKQRTDQDIETAWTIQEGFLVKDWPQNNPCFQVYGETSPAKVIGGDFYDFVQPRPDVVGLLIGDVSGKGVPAALTMAQLLAEFRLHVRDLESPAAVLRRLNDDLSERSRRGLFCTLCYLTLNLRTGIATCANAGHHPVLCVERVNAGMYAGASGPPLGVVRQGTWKDEQFEVAPGDTLVLYTDGILEARSMSTGHENENAPPNEYGSAGLRTAVRPHASSVPKVLIEAVMNDVRRFCAPAAPHDDCTMIALRYLKAGA